MNCLNLNLFLNKKFFTFESVLTNSFVMSGMFFVALPSNTGFPGNKSSKFTTELPQVLHFDDGKFECAVYSFYYTHSFETSEPGDAIYFIHVENGDVIGVEGPTENFTSIYQAEKSINLKLKSDIDSFYANLNPKRIKRDLRTPQRTKNVMKDNSGNRTQAETNLDYFEIRKIFPEEQAVIITESDPRFQVLLQMTQAEAHFNPKNPEPARVVAGIEREVEISPEDLGLPFNKVVESVSSRTTPNEVSKKISYADGQVLPTDDLAILKLTPESVPKYPRKVSVEQVLKFISDETLRNLARDTLVIQDHEQNYIVFPKNAIPFSVKIEYNKSPIVQQPERALDNDPNVPASLIEPEKPKVTKLKKVSWKKVKVKDDTEHDKLENIQFGNVYEYHDGNFLVMWNPETSPRQFFSFIVTNKGEVIDFGTDEFWKAETQIPEIPDEGFFNRTSFEDIEHDLNIYTLNEEKFKSLKKGNIWRQGYDYIVYPKFGDEESILLVISEDGKVMDLDDKDFNDVYAKFSNTLAYEHILKEVDETTMLIHRDYALEEKFAKSFRETPGDKEQISEDAIYFVGELLQKFLESFKNSTTSRIPEPQVPVPIEPEVTKESEIPSTETPKDTEDHVEDKVPNSQIPDSNIANSETSNQIPKFPIKGNYDIETENRLIPKEIPKDKNIEVVEIPYNPVIGTKRKFDANSKTRKLTHEEIENLKHGLRFHFNKDKGRFVLKDASGLVKYISMSDQMTYMLGYEENQKIRPNVIAKYTPDIQKGIHRFCIYENSGLTELMIFGDKMTSLLRVVNVTSKPGENVEQCYTAPMYKRVIAREVSEIDISIKTMQGKLVPFNYGETLVFLVFRRAY